MDIIYAVILFLIVLVVSPFLKKEDHPAVEVRVVPSQSGRGNKYRRLQIAVVIAIILIGIVLYILFMTMYMRVWEGQM